MTIKELQNYCHKVAKEHGWWEAPFIPEKLLMMHSEISEATEDLRENKMETVLDNGKPTGFTTEMADIAIRLLDLCEYLHIDLEREIAIKMKYNEQRSYRHGNKTL